MASQEDQENWRQLLIRTNVPGDFDHDARIARLMRPREKQDPVVILVIIPCDPIIFEKYPESVCKPWKPERFQTVIYRLLHYSQIKNCITFARYVVEIFFVDCPNKIRHEFIHSDMTQRVFPRLKSYKEVTCSVPYAIAEDMVQDREFRIDFAGHTSSFFINQYLWKPGTLILTPNEYLLEYFAQTKTHPYKAPGAGDVFAYVDKTPRREGNKLFYPDEYVYFKERRPSVKRDQQYVFTSIFDDTIEFSPKASEMQRITSLDRVRRPYLPIWNRIIVMCDNGANNPEYREMALACSRGDVLYHASKPWELKKGVNQKLEVIMIQHG